MAEVVERLEKAARSFENPRAVLDLLQSLADTKIRDGDRLARLHDILLFLCAYPANAEVLRRAESMLRQFRRRVAALDDDSPLLDPEVSGIAGTSVDVIFSFDFVRWLVQRFGKQLEIDWDDDNNPESRATVFTSLLPFLAEESSVDANTPYGEWLGAAKWRAGRLVDEVGAAAYDGLQLWIRWTLGDSRVTRTRMRRPARTIFYQRTPLVPRRDVSIERELAGERLPVARLSRREGEAFLDMARAAIATRYRELYCFTFGDPANVVSADCGRGLEIVVNGIAPEKRLPLRAGFGAFFFRNGVPIGYADALGLAERMEVSFNIFYAFRSGESAFCFARLLKLYHQLFGSTSFSIDPYQIGHHNEEAIEAGAFWFYRKLGFRSSDPGVEGIARREEERMADDPRHRTPARTLRRMAVSPLVYDLRPEWNGFHVRNIGLRIARRFAKSGATRAAFTEECRRRVSRIVNVPHRVAGDLALVLDLIEGLARWSKPEKSDVREILRAKNGRCEASYLRLLARHERLRRAILACGRSRE